MNARSLSAKQIWHVRGKSASKLVWVLWILGCFSVPAATGDEQGNGIVVGQPKVFDNRSLASMIEQFEDSLSATGFVSKTDLAAAIGNYQGSETKDSSQALQISTLPTPQIATTATGANGVLSPTSQTITTNTVTPQSPSPDTTNGSLPEAVTKRYGIAAADLLNQQVDLTYQLFNLRMLLERSLSDRNFNEKPRLQSVIGFQISLNPPQKYKGCAAVVEIRILPASGTEPVSLVAMMPQEKTYNVATLTTKTNQFGAAAIVKVVQVGFSERRRGQTFFLVKDTDTYSFERDEKAADGQAKPLTFGWIFRPVLDRSSVDAGIRQVFAVIAPPVEDSSTSQASAQNVRVSVKTYWVPFDHKSSTVKDAAKKGSDRSREDQSLPLFTSPELQKDLSAKVSQLEWAEYGTDSALVKVSGDHFYSGTGAFVGGASLDKPSNGFYLKDDHYLQLVVPLRSLTLQDGEINGRYGSPAPLLNPDIEAKKWKEAPRWGFRMYETVWTPNPDRSSSSLRISVFGKDGKSAPDLHGQKPLVSVGGQTFPPSLTNPLANDSCPDSQDGKSIPRSCLSFRIEVPSTIISAEAPLDISVPFMGGDYHLHGFIYLPFRSVTATRISDGEDVAVGLSGTVFADGVGVYADRLYTLGKDPELRAVARDLIVLTLKKKTFDAVKNLAVISPGGTSHVVAVPSAKSDAPKEATPKPTVSGTPQTALNASQGVSFAGKNLQSIKKVSFEGDDLQFVAAKDGLSITIYVTRKVTGKAGLVDLLASTEDGTLVPIKLNVTGASPAAATASPSKKGKKN